MKKNLLQQMKKTYTAQDFSKLCFDFPEVLELIMTGIGTHYCSRSELDQEISEVSLLSRFYILGRSPENNLRQYAWNMYYLSMMLSVSGKLAEWQLDLLDKFMDKYASRLDTDVTGRLLGARACVLNNLNRINPFKYAKQALTACREAQLLDYKESDYELWLGLKLCESTCLIWQPGAEYAENIEQSIAGSIQLIKILKGSKRYGMIRTAHNNLGISYGRRTRGNRADNVELSIEHYKKALEVSEKEEYLSSKASMINNLGLIYRKRIRGDKAENIESSIEYLNTALEIHSNAGNLLNIAQTLTNLGVSYCDRILGNRSDNLNRAIKFYLRALKYLNPEKHAGFRSWTTRNLGVAYHYLP
ncbi:tetratricopeptide repeat protein [bacterium]|nr:tetratricopeptide repeat protein [bacterium]